MYWLSLTCLNRKDKLQHWSGGINNLTERFLTLFFDFPFEKSHHDVFRGHVQRKLSFTVHRPDVSAMLYQVSSKTIHGIQCRVENETGKLQYDDTLYFLNV